MQNLLGICSAVVCVCTQRACFTSTKVKILTRGDGAARGSQFACFTSTKVQILTQKALQRHCSRFSICLLYEYKSTNTDAKGAAEAHAGPVLSLCTFKGGLASGGRDGWVKVWGASAGRPKTAASAAGTVYLALQALYISLAPQALAIQPAALYVWQGDSRMPLQPQALCI